LLRQTAYWVLFGEMAMSVAGAGQVEVQDPVGAGPPENAY
jgi:hypothetical protein